METTKVGDKYSALFLYFSEHLQWHKARIKFFVLLITALCKMQTVCFERLAEGMDSSAQISSCLRILSSKSGQILGCFFYFFHIKFPFIHNSKHS